MDIVIKDLVSASLDQLGAKIKDREPMLLAAGSAVEGLARRSFNDPGVRAAPWAPLKESTLKKKISEGTSTAILKRSTLLARSWHTSVAGQDSVRVGSDRFYALFQQFGTRRGLPPRPMLPLTGGATAPHLTELAVVRAVDAARSTLKDLLS